VRCREGDEQANPQDRQHARSDQQHGQDADDVIGRLLRPDQHGADEPLAGGGRHVAGRQAERTSNRGEPVALGLQPCDDLRQRRECLPAVPPAVVEHDDRAPAAARAAGGDDARDPWPGPVPGVQAGEND
jgi:hypothetical protein